MSNDVCTIGSVVVGVCEAKAPGHPRNFTGVWVTGSAILSIDGESAVCENDIGVTDCGHTLIAISGSSTGSSLHNNLHRVVDGTVS